MPSEGWVPYYSTCVAVESDLFISTTRSTASSPKYALCGRSRVGFCACGSLIVRVRMPRACAVVRPSPMYLDRILAPKGPRRIWSLFNKHGWWKTRLREEPRLSQRRTQRSAGQARNRACPGMAYGARAEAQKSHVAPPPLRVSYRGVKYMSSHACKPIHAISRRVTLYIPPCLRLPLFGTARQGGINGIASSVELCQNGGSPSAEHHGRSGEKNYTAARPVFVSGRRPRVPLLCLERCE